MPNDIKAAELRKSKLERELDDPWKKEGCDRLVVYTPEVLRSALHNALSKGELDDVKLCVDRGASLEWRDEGDGIGMTALHIAVCCDAPLPKKLAVIDYLIDERVNLDAIDYMEASPLHCAAALGEPEVVSRLIKAGANPRAWDAESLTPLHLAANSGHIAACRALTANWAPVDESDLEPEELHDPKVVNQAEKDRIKRQGNKRVQLHGVSVYVARRGTPLHVCAAADRAHVAQSLIEEAGADVNSGAGPQQSTPLHLAARMGHKDMCLLLLDNGAAVNAADAQGDTPLIRAVEGRHTAIARLLIQRGADAKATNERGITALHIAAGGGVAEAFRLLVGAGGDPNCPDTNTYKDFDGGRTPMHYAAHHGNLRHFQLLLELGGDMRCMSKVGWPALFYAVENSKAKPAHKGDKNLALELVEWIVQCDTADNVWCTAPNGKTPLMLAAIQGAKECAELLCRTQRWSLNMRDGAGRTALHWAALRAEGDTLEVLLRAGAKPNLRDQDGKTAGELYPHWTRPPTKRQWEEERMGPEGEARWEYGTVMENTAFRYLRKTMAARRTREIARERLCQWCQRFTFDAMRCGACKDAFYCSSGCQKKDWQQGGHRLFCTNKHKPKPRNAWAAMEDMHRRPY